MNNFISSGALHDEQHKQLGRYFLAQCRCGNTHEVSVCWRPYCVRASALCWQTFADLLT